MTSVGPSTSGKQRTMMQVGVAQAGRDMSLTTGTSPSVPSAMKRMEFEGVTDAACLIPAILNGPAWCSDPFNLWSQVEI